MKNSGKIETFSKDQLDDLLNIEEASFSNPWTREAFAAAINSPDMEIITCCRRDSVTGYIVLYRIRQILVIANLAVRASFRRRGLGRALLEAGIRHGREHGCNYSVLDVRQSNIPAIKLYEEAGFSSIGVNEGYYRNPPEDSLVMGRTI